jgi:ankyrin repeat protein
MKLLRFAASSAAMALLVVRVQASPESEHGRALTELAVLGAAPTSEAFVRAVASRHRPLAEFFLGAKVDVNATTEGGRTALLTAAMNGDAPLVERLLALGADPSRADAEGATPLMLAAASGHLPTISALRGRGASLDATDSAGRTPLHYAVAARRLPVLAEFFKNPAQLETALRDSTGLAHLATATDDRAIIEFVLSRLQEKAEWSAPARAWCNHALQNRDADFLRLFLAKYSGPPAPDMGMQPWLAYAVATNDLALLKFMLDCGTDPNAALDAPRDQKLRETIHPSFMRYHVENEPGMTPLMLAAGIGNADAISLLLAAGAKRGTGTTGKSRLVAIYFACWANDPVCTQALIEDAPSRDRLRIEVSLKQQQATFLKNGQTVLETTISTGRAGFATKPGEYVVTDKRRDHTSSIYQDAKMPFFMRLSCKDFGLHEGRVTGRPASHGCVRLPGNVARRLFSEVPIGTWVSIK